MPTKKKTSTAAVKKKKKVVKSETPKTNKVAKVDPNTPVITKWHAEGNLFQIYSSGLEFAFVNEAGEQCHPFAFCKDYLQDAIWATIHKSAVQVHGFDYKHGRNPTLDLEKTRIAVRLRGNKNFKTMCEKSLKFMQEMDTAMGFEPMQLQYGGKYMDKTDDIFVFVGDKNWMYSPVLISLVTLAIRVGMTYEGGDWKEHFTSAKKYLGSNDKSYTSQVAKGLDKVVGKKPSKIFAPTFEANYPKDVPTSTLHHRSGIVTFSSTSGVDAKVKQNWYKA